MTARDEEPRCCHATGGPYADSGTGRAWLGDRREGDDAGKRRVNAGRRGSIRTVRSGVVARGKISFSIMTQFERPSMLASARRIARATTRCALLSSALPLLLALPLAGQGAYSVNPEANDAMIRGVAAAQRGEHTGAIGEFAKALAYDETLYEAASVTPTPTGNALGRLDTRGNDGRRR